MDLRLVAHSRAWCAAINPDFAADFVAVGVWLFVPRHTGPCLVSAPESTLSLSSTLSGGWGCLHSSSALAPSAGSSVHRLVSVPVNGMSVNSSPLRDWGAVGWAQGLTAPPMRARTWDKICYFYLFQFLLANFVSTVSIQSQDRTTFCLKAGS